MKGFWPTIRPGVGRRVSGVGSADAVGVRNQKPETRNQGPKFRIGRFWVAALLLCIATAASATETRPAVLEDVGIDQRLNEQVPLDLVFRDESGAPVRLGTYFGSKPVILSLAYYECPMLCTLVLNGLASALKVLSFDAGKEFEVVTVSFNPADTPALAAAKKQTYLKAYGRPGAAAGWHFLTGDAAAIEQLTRAVGFRYKYVPEQQQFAHAAGIMVLTPQGKLARYFYGVEFSPRDLRLGLIEAAQNKIGTAVDQLLLFCFHYDPATGKYGAIAMGSVRAAGVLTVLALATFLTVMLRRDRARRRTSPFEKGGERGISSPAPPQIPPGPPLSKGGIHKSGTH
jgi:protein SCO1/2